MGQMKVGQIDRRKGRKRDRKGRKIEKERLLFASGYEACRPYKRAKHFKLLTSHNFNFLK